MISIYTPTHNTKYLTQLWESIKDQYFNEWVILAQDCEVPDFVDNRVRVYNYPKLGEHWVGALKKEAVKLCTGDILLEVDHDDLLTPNAIEEVKKAFEDKEIGFVYSNTVEFMEEFEKTERYNEDFGWKYRPFTWNGHELDECISFEPSPMTFSMIWYAPNHLRAWRREAYEKAGGYSQDMRVLDDQDLLSRTYLVTKCKHIDKPLYLYRITGENTFLKYNDEIQNNVMRLYDKYIERLALVEEGLKLDLGGRFNSDSRYQSVDLKDADIIADLNGRFPFEDESVSVIRANDIFEHLKDSINTMKEIYRILKPGGMLIGQVPSTDGRGAFQDPTHVSFWNENSFLYYTDKNYAQYIDTPVRFQATRLYTTEGDVKWVKFNLIKLNLIKPEIKI